MGRDPGAATAASSSPGRIIFVNRFFYPDHSATSELVSDLAFALAKRRFCVIVITSRQTYEIAQADLPSRQRIDGVDIWRIWTSKRGRLRLIGRGFDYLTFYLAAGFRVWRLAKRGDIIVAKTDPPLLSVVIAPIAWLKRALLINWLQDIFPEVAATLNVGGRLGRRVFSLMRPIRNWSLRFANANIAVGNRMAARLEAEGIPTERIHIVSNWADGEFILPSSGPNTLRQSWAPNMRFIVGYAGNLGRAHDIDTILEAITILHKQGVGALPDNIARRVLFIFVGGGAQRAKLEREILKRGLTNVRLHPYQPRELLAKTLAVADVHLVSLNPKLEGLIVPSKFYGIAAAGRPTLFIGAADGEIAQLIDEFECGFTVPPGDGKGLADRILQMAQDLQLCATLGDRARAAFEKHWDKNGAVKKWEEVLQAVATTAQLKERSASGTPSDFL